jgi:hypothetical protein
MEEHQQCAAMTHSGSRCRNRAQEGSEYCYIHRAQAEPSDTPQAANPERERMEAVADRLNQLAAEVQAADPGYRPPPFSAAALTELLNSSMEHLAAALPEGLIKDIIRNLEGTKPEDLLDPETWKGLWYILNYTLEMRSKELLQQMADRISAIPGMDMIVQLGVSVWESPRDLLDVETWKGGVVVLNAAVQVQMEELRKLVFGTDKEES